MCYSILGTKPHAISMCLIFRFNLGLQSELIPLLTIAPDNIKHQLVFLQEAIVIYKVFSFPLHLKVEFTHNDLLGILGKPLDVSSC